ncbi:beta-lactamase/transpeptidase-like protein, partial [Trichophaea hybrida]
CPPPGPVLPVPTQISNSPHFVAAAANLTSFLDSSLTDATLNTTTFSILLVSASNPHPLWQYHHTTPGSVVSNITVNAHSQYRIGSVSKVFADLLLLRLGLPLDAPVTKWLPELRKGNGGVDWDSVTLRMLGSHMAGILRDYNAWTQNYTNAATFEALGYPKLTPKDYPPCEVEALPRGSLGCTEKQVLQGMADSNPVFPSGLKPTYSNVGFNLLGFVIERETGMTYEDAVKKYITQPLGMSRTEFLPARTNGVIPARVGLWHADLGQFNPAGGVYSTVSDLSILARSILTPTSGLLPPSTLRSWLKPVVFGISSVTQAVGFPWEITRTTKLSRNGVIDIYSKGGDLPSFGAIFSLIPEYAIGVVVLTAGGNTAGSKYSLADTVMARIVPSLEDVVR